MSSQVENSERAQARTLKPHIGSSAANPGGVGPSGDGLVSEFPASGLFAAHPEEEDQVWTWTSLEPQLNGIAEEHQLTAWAQANGYDEPGAATILVMEEPTTLAADLPTGTESRDGQL